MHAFTHMYRYMYVLRTWAQEVVRTTCPSWRGMVCFINSMYYYVHIHFVREKEICVLSGVHTYSVHTSKKAVEAEAAAAVTTGERGSSATPYP